MNTKAKKSTYTFDVVCGPNLDRLLDSFKYAYDFNAKVPVTFVIAEHYTGKKGEPSCGFTQLEIDKIRINSIAHESGNDYSFELHGYCEAALGDVYYNATTKGYVKALVPAGFRCYYNTKTREGNITFHNLVR